MSHTPSGCRRETRVCDGHNGPMVDSVSPPLRPGVPGDIDACVALWVDACAVRDGRAFDGVAERARPKFDRRVVWLVAGGARRVNGFALATAPGTGLPTDPSDAAVLGLLAVDPNLQTRGLGRALLHATSRQLRRARYEQAVLHALPDNRAALALYESEGWVAVGDPSDHSLLRRPMQTFTLDLRADFLSATEQN